MPKFKEIHDPRIPKYLEDIKNSYLENNNFSDDVVAKMKELREIYKEHKQPTLVKSVRLVYEFAADFDGFHIQLWEDENDISSLEYYLDLLSNPFNKYNREEIKELNNYLKAKLNGEDVEFMPETEEDEAEEEEA
jgi:hypothetical protein